MAFFRKLFSGGGKSKKREYPYIIRGVDPLESWQKVGELGDGAFGKVFKTEHRDSGKLAAMKRVPIQNETDLDDFMVEIEILAECKHRNIVGLHEAYFYDQALWIYIEFCAGGAVDDIIVELDHGLSEPQIQCISRQVCEALDFLHSSHCIHRDLKAGNILLCADGSVRLADFGVSAKNNPKGKQKHDTFIGTPYWMAPEVVLCETIKDDPYDYAADIWSCGITMIELADMNPPYHEMSPMRVLQKIVKKEPPMLAVPSRWSKKFNDFIAKCLVKDPSGRLTAGQLLDHAFIAGIKDNKPLRILYCEMKSEVQEIVEELPEDADLTTDPGHTESLISETSSIQSESTPTPTPREDASPFIPKESDIGPTPVAITTPQDSEIGVPQGSETSPQDSEIPPQNSDIASPKVSDVIPEDSKTGSPDSDIGPEPVLVSPKDDETPPEEPITLLSPSSSSVPESVQSPVPESDKVEAKVKPKQEDERSSLASEMSAPSEDKRGREGKDHKYATLSRVRKFKVDGKVMQSTTRKIVDVTSNQTLRDNKKYRQLRKQDFRELKQLQREEMKEATEYYTKIKVDREIQEKKFEAEIAESEKRHEAELELIAKQQKKEKEKQESQHIQQFKQRLKYIKSQQSKDLKRFKDNLKEEAKLALKRVEVSVSKAERKMALNKAKLELELKKVEKEEAFSNKQATELETEVQQILREQKDERKTLVLSFLNAEQDLRRNHKSLAWEMEQRHKQDRHQLLKQQVREAFHMQRHQMHVRHQMEVDLQGRRDQFRQEELRQTQLLEKRQLPKILKAKHKEKVAEARKAMRNSKKPDKDSLRKLDEEYVQLCQLETELMNEKHEKDMETLRAELDANMKELLEIQNEKKMQLTTQESIKIKDRDEQHTLELRDWRGEIAKRKQKLEEEFRITREEQEGFYSQDRPIPKQLRSSLSLPATSRSERASKSLSTSSLDPQSTEAVVKGASRPPLQALDELVLNTPVLSHSSMSDADAAKVDAVLNHVLPPDNAKVNGNSHTD